MQKKLKLESKPSLRNYQICNRCVMDTSDRWIVFDSNGVCNHCKDYLEKRVKNSSYQGEDTIGLDTMFNNIKEKRKNNSKYDVVVGLSGGVDSCTTAYLAQKSGLRVLAVHMDNCWDSPIASHNIKKLISLPRIDYHCEVLDWNNFKQIQRIWIEAGVPDIETPTDSAIGIIVWKIAAQNNIRIILSGGNISNEGILPSSWMYNSRDSLYINSVIRKAGKSKSIFSDIKFGLRQEIYYRFYRRIKTFYPLNTFKYNKNEARKILEKELDWKNPGQKHSESIYTRFCQQIYQPMRHGMDYRRAHLSQDICLKRITREDALDELQKPPWDDLDVDFHLAFIAQKLGYSIDELRGFLGKSPLWHTDYPNRELALGYLYNFYRLLRGKPLAKNFWG